MEFAHFGNAVIILLLKIIIVLALAAAAVWCLRGKSAVLRFRLWLAVFFTLAVIPFIPYSIDVTNPALASVVVVKSSSHSQALSAMATPLRPAPQVVPGEQLPSVITTDKASFPWRWSIWLVYGAVLVIGLARLVGSHLRERGRYAKARAASHDEIQYFQMLTETPVWLWRGLTVVMTPQTVMPRTWGFSPILLLPEQALNWPETSLRNVLLHELAHIRRRDFVLGLFVDLVALAYWPVIPVWWARKNLALERERACDEAVLRHGATASEYAGQLLGLARQLGQGHLRHRGAMAFLHGSHLKNRVTSILSFRHHGKPGWSYWLLPSVLLSAGVCLAAISPVAPRLEAAPDPAQAQNQQEPRRTGDAKSVSAARLDRPQALADFAERAMLQQDLDAIPMLIDMLGDMRPIEAGPSQFFSRWGPANHEWRYPAPGETAAIALASLGGSSVPPLIEALDAPNEDVRINAAWALGEIRGHERQMMALPSLLAVVAEDPVWQVRHAAAYALAEVKSPIGGPALMEALEDIHPDVRHMAAWALGELKYRKAVPLLSTMVVEDAEPRSRRMAAWSLGEIASRRGAEALRLALNDESEAVQDMAAWALKEMDLEP